MARGSALLLLREAWPTEVWSTHLIVCRDPVGGKGLERNAASVSCRYALTLPEKKSECKLTGETEAALSTDSVCCSDADVAIDRCTL